MTRRLSSSSPHQCESVRAKPLATKEVEEPKVVREHVGGFAKPLDGQALVAVLVTLALYFFMFTLPWYFVPLHSLVIVRLFIVCVHDAAHGSLFNNPWHNFLVGTLSAPLTGFTYNYWKWGHDYHHHHSNDLDYEQWSQTAPITVTQFKAFAPWQQAVFRLFTTPSVLLTAGAPFITVILQPISADTMLDWALQVAWWVLLSQHGCLLRYIAALTLAAPVALFLFHTQHTFETCVREKGLTKTGEGYYANAMRGSSYLQLPQVLKFFTAGIEYHHIHHLNAKVPCYRLQDCHESADPSMWRGVKVMTIAEGWQSLRYCMWDEAQNKLISMKEFDTLHPQL